MLNITQKKRMSNFWGLFSASDEAGFLHFFEKKSDFFYKIQKNSIKILYSQTIQGILAYSYVLYLQRLQILH